MKNKITKVLAALLTLCMLVGMFVMPASAEGAIIADETWYKEDADVLYIYDAADLLAFSEKAQEQVQVGTDEESGDPIYEYFNFEGKTIKLMADIDLNPGWDASTTINGNSATLANDSEDMKNPWNSIPVFKGTFDGQGHTIKGICAVRKINSDDNRGGLVDSLVGGTIENFVLLNGLVVGYSTTVGGINRRIGGIVGDIDNGTVRNIYSDLDVWWRTDVETKAVPEEKTYYYRGSAIALVGALVGTGESIVVDDIAYAGHWGIVCDGSIEKKKVSDDTGSYCATTLGHNNSDSNSIVFGDIAIIGGDPNRHDGRYQTSDMFISDSNCNGVIIRAIYWDGDSDCVEDDMLNTKCDWAKADPNDKQPTNPSKSQGVWHTGTHTSTDNEKKTYAERGWVKITSGGIVPQSNNNDYAKANIQYVPGAVADMLTSNSLSTSDLYVQEKLDGSAIRFIGVVDVSEAELANLDSLGMNVSMTYAGKTYSYSFTTTTVYKSLLANGVKVDVSELNGTYFYAIEITGLNGATGDVKFDFSGTVIPNGANSVVFASASYTYAK